MSVSEDTYYARHFRLPGFGEKTQAKLRAARVLVIGVGGLGCPAALYLTGAGIGHITLCDADVVSATNLHRQVLFDVSSIGLKKVDVAAERLRGLNPHIQVETVDRFVEAALLAELVGQYDLVLDGTDNFSAKFAISDACGEAGVPLVYGSIFQYEGQVSVFHLPTTEYPKGFSYRDLFPDGPPPGLTQNCGEAGVVGVLPGVVGTLQATEAFKVLAGMGDVLAGQLLTYDALSATWRKLVLAKRKPSEAGLAEQGAPTLPYAEYLRRAAGANPPVLLDVREVSERQAISLGGLHVPLASLHLHASSLPKEGDLVVYCKSGVRSARAALYLQSVLPQVRVLSLGGGVDAAAGSGFSCA